MGDMMTRGVAKKKKTWNPISKWVQQYRLSFVIVVKGGECLGVAINAKGGDCWVYSCNWFQKNSYDKGITNRYGSRISSVMIK